MDNETKIAIIAGRLRSEKAIRDTVLAWRISVLADITHSSLEADMPGDTYTDYRLRLRHHQVVEGYRRPPKKAVCSARRRGRKFKG